MKKIIFILAFLFCLPCMAGGLNASFGGSRYTGGTKNSTVFESWGDVTGANVLIDHSGSNLLTYTEAFDDAAWTKTNVTVTADQVRGPGSLMNNADLLTPTAADSYVYQDATAVVGTQYTCSFYLRSVTGNANLSIHAYDQAHGTILGTKEILITPYWQRFYVSGILVAGDTDVGCTIGGNTTWSTGENIYGVRAQTAENNEWNTNLGIYHPRLAGTNKPLLDLADNNDPTSAYTDLQSSDGNRLPAREFVSASTQDYRLAHHDSMDVFDEDHTLTMYVNQDIAALGFDRIFSHATASSGMDIYSQNLTNWRARYRGAGSTSVNIDCPIITTNTNLYGIIQLVRQNNIVICYLNGVAGTPIDVSGFGVDGDATLYIGSEGGNYFDGKIGYARLDAEALSTDDLAADRERILGIATNWSRDNQWSFERSTVATKQFSAGGANALTPTLVQVPANVARVAGKGSGVLIESQSQNVFLQSNNFPVTWTQLRLTSITNNGMQSLNGNMEGDGLVADVLNANHGVYQLPTLTATTYTWSVFAKAGDHDWLFLLNNTAPNPQAYFNLATCTAGSIAGGSLYSHAEPYPDGWCRCSVTFTGTAVAHSLFYITAISDGVTAFIGDTVTVNTWLWEAQIEPSPFPTSPISTTNAAVTRTADDLTIDPHPANTNERILPELFAPGTPADKLSVYFEAKCEWSGSVDIGEHRYLMTISGNGGTAAWNRNRFWIYTTSAGIVSTRLYDNGNTQRYMDSAVDPIDFDEWFSIRMLFDFTDLSRSMQWINEVENITGGVNNMTGTATFNTSDVSIRIEQAYNGLINGNCHIRTLRINNKEILAP